MAKTVEEFEWGTGGRPRKYPWDEWLNGEIWVLRYGEDYHCDVDTVRSAAKKMLRRTGRTLRSRVLEDGAVLVIQVIPKVGDFDAI